MKKTIKCFIVFLTVISMVVISFPLNVSAESLYIKKIVSVVYDDSGSMINGGSANWAYANYAMQAFCGLLNSDDQLYITYMSEAENNPKLNPSQTDLSSNKIQSSIDSIRSHTQVGNTPYGALDVAFNKLKSVQDSNENTQYWLVIITDGAFQNGLFDVTDAQLNDKIGDFSDQKMPNGAKPQITYLAIGDSAIVPTEKPNQGIYVYESAGAGDIVNVMSEIADQVSGRSRLEQTDVKLLSDTTVQITSSIPLLNIAVLSQNTSAKIKSAAYDGGGELEVTRSVSIRYPQVSNWVTDTSLQGSAFLISDGSDNINAGTYTIEFNDKISLDNVVLMFEPALEIRMTVSANGVELDDFSMLEELREGDKVDVAFKLYEFGTDNEISSSLLPDGTEYSIKVNESGKNVSSVSGMSYEGIELHQCATEIIASVQIKGFNPIKLTTGEFTPEKGVIYAITVDQPDNFSMTMAQLKQNTDKIRFYITADGQPITKADAEALPFKIDTKMPGESVYEDDGSISFLPQYKDPITAIPTGDVEVIGAIENDVSAKTTFYIKPIEYTISPVDSKKYTLIRTKLKENEKGVSFEVFADGERLDKEAVEVMEFTFTMSEPYDEKLTVQSSIADNGLVKVMPRYNGLSWLAAYLIPLGELEITAAANKASAAGTLTIGNEALGELIFNYIIPIAILLFIIGHLVKKRFKYSSQIYYNFGQGSGFTVSGPRANWNSESLMTWKAFVPFITDSKNVNGAKFYASARLWGNRAVITVKAKHHPEYSGTLDGGLSPLETVRFNRGDVSLFDGEKQRNLTYDNALITSGDPNFSACQIYLYSDE